MVLKEDYGIHGNRGKGYCGVSGDVIYDIVELENGKYSVSNFKFKNIKGTIYYDDEDWEEERDLENEMLDLWRGNGGVDNILIPLTKGDYWDGQTKRWWNEGSLQGHYVAYFEASYDIDYDAYSKDVTWIYDKTLQFDYFCVEEKDGRKIN